jgi:hypothetical protein
MLPIERTHPFKHNNSSPQYLMVLKNATHMTFANAKRHSVRHFDKCILKGCVLFFDAHLKQDKSALKELKDGFQKMLNAEDAFETK